MSPVNLTKSIGKNLSASSEAIDQLRNDIEEQKGKAPKNAEVMEARLRAIQGEIDSLSEKMLAYKLQRLASSKMLAQVSELSQAEQKAAEAKAPEILAPEPAAPAQSASQNSEKKQPQKMVQGRKKTPKNEYNSSTFQCKSDLDICLEDSKSALDRALCYALFIRCAVKG